MAVKLSKEEFLKRAISIHNNAYDYTKTKFINIRSKITVNCPVHGDFTVLAKTHIYNRDNTNALVLGGSCPKCASIICNKNRANKTPIVCDDEIIAMYKRLYPMYTFKNKIDRVWIISKKTKTRYQKRIITFECPQHGIQRVNWVPKTEYKKDICLLCSIERKRIPENVFLDKLKNKFGDTVDYSKVIYVNGSTPITLICPIHGEFSALPYELLRKRRRLIACTKCCGSTSEEIIKQFLVLNKIEYIRQYRLPMFKTRGLKLRYDFYLPKLNLLIEFDGIQHFVPIEAWGGLEYFKTVQTRDELKNKFAKIYDIPLLRISYKNKDNIEKLLINFISYYWQYKHNNVFYRNFVELIENLKLDPTLRPKDLTNYLTLTALKEN
nr:MAG TPA: restriction enzyme [Caudoviricetes sp.]